MMAGCAPDTGHRQPLVSSAPGPTSMCTGVGNCFEPRKKKQMQAVAVAVELWFRVWYVLMA